MSLSLSPLLDNSHRITSLPTISDLAGRRVVGENCRIKDYGSWAVVSVFSRPVRGREHKSAGGEGEPLPPRERDDSRRRAAQRVYDITALNSWRWWVTLTFGSDGVDRHDRAAVMAKLRVWLSNAVQRRGARYVAVWERHKRDIEGLHVHLLYDGELPVVYSGHRDRKGHKVYNVTAWPWGFSTAIEVYEQGEALTRYLTKYLVKSGEKLAGKWYWSGGELAREPPTTWTVADYATAEGKEVFVEAANMSVKYITVRYNDDGSEHGRRVHDCGRPVSAD